MPRPGQPPAPCSDAAAPAPRRGTVLVVEDDELVRNLAHRVLAQAGYKVLVAADVATALALLVTDPTAPDAVISDAVMPRASGRELVARLRCDRPDLPVLLMSGHAPDNGTCRGAHDAFLQKPFTVAELVDATRLLIATAGRRQPQVPQALPQEPALDRS